MKSSPTRSLRNAQSGVMLLEALIGILIFSLGILAMVGMQAMSIRLASDARDRAEAASLASQLVGDMWLHRTTLADFQYPGSGTVPPALTTWITQVNETLPDAAALPPIIAVGAAPPPLPASVGTQTTVTMQWRNPGDTAIHQFVMTAYIN
jgi:type IV pilus assembly protein PilV